MREQPVLRIGLVSDVQYGDKVRSETLCCSCVLILDQLGFLWEKFFKSGRMLRERPKSLAFIFAPCDAG